MIYVLASSAFKDNSLSEHMNLIKIGYTDDSSKKLRYSQYKLHNPSVIVLYEIPDCGTDIEDQLHQFFSKFRYDMYGREWYYWDEEIIQFFETNKTKEDLIKVLVLPLKKDVIIKKKKYYYQIIDTCLKYKIKYGELDYLTLIKNNKKDLCYKQLLLSDFYEKSEIKDYILSYFNISSSDFDLFIKSISTNIPEILKFIDDFNSTGYFTDKMKLLCEFCEGKEEKLVDQILNQVPTEYSRFYYLLGPKKIKALCYKKGELIKYEKRLQDIDNKEEVIIKLIKDEFSIGERLDLPTIKSRIGKVFKDNSIDITPKATLLLDIFEIKRTKVKISEGTYTNGFEILCIKE